jgi:hypothetical protein
MGLLEWMSPTRWVILLAMLLALTAAFFGYGQVCANEAREAEHNRMQLAIDELQLEAAQKLAAATKRALALERQVAQMQADKEADYEKRRMDSRAAALALADDVARHGGRLFDPAGQCGSSGGGAPSEAADDPRSGAGDRAQGTGLLSGGTQGLQPGRSAGGFVSAPLTALITRLLDEAQEVNDAYSICRDTLLLWKRQYDPLDGP